MKPAPFDYLRAETLAEALEGLAAEGGDARVLAGGQTLVPLLSMRLARPKLLIDIMRSTELGRITIHDDRSSSAQRCARPTSSHGPTLPRRRRCSRRRCRVSGTCRPATEGPLRLARAWRSERRDSAVPLALDGEVWLRPSRRRALPRKDSSPA